EHPEKIDQLAAEASFLFDVELEKNLTLITIRHYNEETIRKYTVNKTVVLEQKTITTVQMLLRI
ncbi:MAG: aspartate kinase, partial [Ferruginibacter sp.]